MKVTLEISLYPIKDDFELHIIEFINCLREYNEITVLTNAMSTYVQGEWTVVMDILKEELGKIYPTVDTTATIIKIVNRKVPIGDGFFSI